jgi:hypothetical protein
MPSRFCFCFAIVVWAVVCGGGTVGSGAKPVSYKNDVAPILAGNCVKCHGPTKQESDFRLDTPDGLTKGGKVGPAIVPGSAKESHLMKAILGTSDDVVAMPPEDGPLSKEQIDVLRRWIDEGAKFK